MMKSTNERSQQALGAQSQPSCCPIVEFRQYTLYPGKRDVLIDLFEQTFIESQEAVGIQIIGQFRDLDNPNRFVWLRGFRNMPSRAQALKDFYTGPVWKAHRDAANATMIDSDNVLLLRPARPTSGFSLDTCGHLPRGTTAPRPGLIIATIYYFDMPVSADFVDFFESSVKPVVIDSDTSIVATFVTEESPNTFPALPVREGEHVLVWFARFSDQAAYEEYVAALTQSRPWRDEVSGELMRRLKGVPEVVRLSPTARSQLHS
jgi:hypothetical protein